MMESVWISKKSEGGSITVFMAFLFLLLFALTGTVLDSARFFSSGGYMKVSAYGADVATYGKYNRELFQEYALFGYGGYDGMGEADWTQEYQQILLDNLSERPTEGNQGVESLFAKKYASVYQLGAVSVSLDRTAFLNEEEQFMKQVDAWMKSEAVQDISEKLLGWIKDSDNGDQQELLEGLEEVEQVEAIKEQQEKEQNNHGEQIKQDDGRGEGGDDNVQSAEETADHEKEEDVSDESKTDSDTTQISSGEKKNPLEFLRELVRDGVLSLVCDVDSLAESEVAPRDRRDMQDDMVGDGQIEESISDGKWDQKKSGSGILKGLLKQSDSLWDEEMFQTPAKTGKLLLYASSMFGSYVSEKGRTAPYGLEYLATGKKNQKDAIAAVINRLFFIRTLLNYAYVSGNPVLQEKSLATATAIAAPLAAEAFIPVIQQSILLILSLEEACVDITALLDGKTVPILKNQTNFKMRYAELCAAGKTLFQQKAAEYSKAGDGVALSSLAKGIGYVHYLWLLLLMTSWDHLFQRSLDLIQADLREKYNQTFKVDDCICQTEVTVTYGVPLLSSIFLVRNIDSIDGNKMVQGMVMRQITVSYGYE